MKSLFTLFLFVSILTFSFLAGNVFSQNKDFIGTRTIEKDGKKALETIPKKNNGLIESLDDHLLGMNNSQGEQFVLGGTVLWSAQDPLAVANAVAINSAGSLAFTGWGLNNLRATLYSDLNSTPLWDFSTQYDPFVDISAQLGLYPE